MAERTEQDRVGQDMSDGWTDGTCGELLQDIITGLILAGMIVAHGLGYI